MGSIKSYYVGSEFCGLCHGKFPESSLQGLDAWQSEFRAVLLLDPHNEHTVETTDVASLPDIRDDVDVTLTGHPQLETVKICRDVQFCIGLSRIGRPAFCFHDWCYSSLIWGVRFHPPKSIIYKLVRTLIPNSSLWENICQARHQLDPRGSLQTLIAHADQSPLNLQPLLMLRLPGEVRAKIWEYVGLSTPYSAFILVATESSRLVRYLESRPTRDFALKRGCQLSAETIMVFGIEYIRDLNYYEDHKVKSEFIRDVVGLKLVTSLGGICAIKVFGVNWETEWLGKVPLVGHVWHGMIQDVGPRLCCAYNDLNCVNISNLEPSSANLILWDQPNFPLSLSDPDKELFDYERDIMGSSQSSVATRERRFFRYLPLFNDAEYIKGLTVYQNGNGITGLEAHFTQSSLLSGCRDGCALYILLCPGERIAYAWLRILNYYSIAFAAPTLIIQTTLRRVYSFGSYIVPDLVVQNEYQWILLKNKGCITGFYYENSPSSTIIMRLGVIGDGALTTGTPLTPQYPARVFPPMAGPNGGTFVTVAFLGGFEKVDLCRVSNRCTGMLVHYPKGPPTVLGQWRSSCVAEHSCIYSSGTKSISNIYFRTSGSGYRRIVTNIGFSEDNGEAAPDSECHIFNLGMYIAWWFSNFCDVILPWTGEFRDIPGESRISQVNLPIELV